MAGAVTIPPGAPQPPDNPTKTRAQLVAASDGELTVVDDVAESFANTVIDAYATRPGSPFSRFSIVLSGGPTARRCYETLALNGAACIDWDLVDAWMGDERCVPADDPDSNQRLVREALLDQVAPVGSFHAMDCTDPGAYDRDLKDHIADAGGFDLVHLGLGPDGHTASLFSGTALLDSSPLRAGPGDQVGSGPGCPLASLSEDPTGRNPHRRMTITLDAIALARLVVFTVAGETKRQALASVMAGEDLPAARVRAARVLWIADREAAADL